MIKKLALTFLMLIVAKGFSQNLFSEQFDDCHQTRFSFCLDCGEPKAQASQDINEFFQKELTEISPKLKGQVFVQVIIDSLGNQCVKSLEANTNRSIKKLNLRERINAMSNWQPAMSKGKGRSATIILEFQFNDGKVEAGYKRLNTRKTSNMKSVGSVEVENKGKFKNNLDSDAFEVFTTENSIIPWDMSRAIIADLNNVIWYGTDNGIVRIENMEMSVLGKKNSPLRSTPYNENKLQAIKYSAVDAKGNKWFVGGKAAYRYDDKNWQVFDSINSPLISATKVHADNHGSVWFTTFKGLIKYDGQNWSVLDTSNSNLPSDIIMGVFLDSKDRLWIGTNKGNIRIDGDQVIEFTDNSPLATATITKGFEDSSGTIWFSLHEKFPQSKGLAKYNPNGTWEVISTENANIPRNDVLDFVVDEKNNRLWLSLNRIGISMYDGEKWQTFTPDNSKVPSTYVQRMAIDKEGNLWCATFAGLLKINL